jgi:potassium voltage-gated channel subfamily G protein 3
VNDADTDPGLLIARIVLDDLQFAFTIIFLIDLIIRFLVSPSYIRFLKRPLNILDILVTFGGIIYYIIKALDRAILNVFKVLRIVLVLKMFRFSRSLKILAYILRACSRELLVLLIYVSLGCVMFSSFVFLAEQLTDKNTEFISIPFTFW